MTKRESAPSQAAVSTYADDDRIPASIEGSIAATQNAKPAPPRRWLPVIPNKPAERTLGMTPAEMKDAYDRDREERGPSPLMQSLLDMLEAPMPIRHPFESKLDRLFASGSNPFRPTRFLDEPYGRPERHVPPPPDKAQRRAQLIEQIRVATEQLIALEKETSGLNAYEANVQFAKLKRRWMDGIDVYSMKKVEQEVATLWRSLSPEVRSQLGGVCHCGKVRGMCNPVVL